MLALRDRANEDDETHSNTSLHISIDRKIALIERFLSEKFVEA